MSKKPEDLVSVSATTPVSSVSPLNLKSTNLPAAWRHWLSLFKIYLRASSLEEQPDSRKVALLLHYMGPDSLDIFNSFNEDLDKITYDVLVKKLDDYFLPKVNIIMERYSFFSRRQGPDESIDEFVTSLKNLSLTCDFETLREDLVRDIFICGLHNKFSHLKEKLLNEDKITLEKAVLTSRSMELNKEHVQQLQAQQTSSFIGALQKHNNNSSSEAQSHRHHRQFSKPARQQHKTSSSSSPQSHIKSSSNRQNSFRYSRHNQQQTGRKNYHQQSSQYTSSNGKNSCKNCGQVHKYTCPAMGVTCYRCRGKDHFSKMCPRNLQVRNIEFATDVSDTESVLSTLFIGVLQQQQNENQQRQRHHSPHHQFQNQQRYQHDEDEPQWHVSLQINNCKISCQLDTRAQGNVMSVNQLQTLGLSRSIIKSSNQNLLTFSGEKIYSLGYCMLNCTYKNIVYKIKFIVVEIDCKCLIGLKTCLEMNLIKKNDEYNLNVNAMCSKNDEKDIHNLPNFVKEFKDVFEGLGCLKEKCHFKVKCDVTPVVDSPRKIPFALMSDFKKELERLENLNVITEVKEPTTWVNSIVLVKKPNGNLRLCLDPRNLNKAILRPHFQFPNVEDIKAQLSGSKYFSVLDANSGFWMIQLDEESSMLCTFHTPFGRRRFLRLPFGINAAPEIFHCEMVKQFSDIPNLEIYIDDFLIHAKTKEEHDKVLKLVLLRARDIGLKFNPSKSKFFQSEITFIGHLFSHDGVRPDPSKVEAICAIPRPKSKTELQRFLGMVNYLGTFVKGMSAQNVNLRNLLKKDVEWHWSDDHEKEFKKLKELISNTPVLTYFDVNKPLTLSVDASQNAVGAVISHDGNPIAYASATLTTSQQNYAQIEKELFAILFGCTKFHAFVFGKSVLVETDHKPLVPLFDKALYKVPARLQRFMLRLLAYDLKVIFKPGKYMYVADTLSRAAMPNETLTEFDKDISLHCNLWGIDHVTSSPYFPRSNGLAERSVQTIKKLLKKCHETNSDLYVALLHYRTTRKGNINSPSELLMSRQLRTKLPVLNENLKPFNVDLDEHNKKIKLQQNKTRDYYDKNAKALPTLTNGQNIYYKKTPISNWEPGIVLQKCPEPRSYLISSKDGSEYRRNREHLLEGSSIDTKKIKSENDDHIRNGKCQQESLPVEGKVNEDVPHSGDSNSLTPTPDYVTRFGRTVAPPNRFGFD
ncbi:uncharacterized protein LOC129949066 [Eupeodes corollae]|uniref:uncharacterized protein LOC129949066 n=1 Tax=Eupeodes corollae TaxID=290404 RepID=UPI002492B2DD|nr:uncharacterized protein LOC129949066 [Eupeodes corollae]